MPERAEEVMERRGVGRRTRGKGVGGYIRHRIASFVGNIWWCMRFLDMEGDGR